MPAACSFSGDTEVLMADGTHKAIAEIKPGDKVLAANPESGESSTEVVTAHWEHQDTLVTLNTAAGTIRTTEDHPFWNATDRAWQPAEEIDPGESILTNSGDEITVSGLDWSAATGGMAYNLTVAELHTYFVVVGEDAVLVHNRCKPVNLPSWSNMSKDWDDIFEGHMPGGMTGNNTLFENMTEAQVKNVVESAYKVSKRVGTQVRPDGQTVAKMIGQSGGMTIEMWVNLSTRTLESAYPKLP